MKKPIIVTLVNHKGGCLKTSVTASLGAALARVGKKVLVVDLDAQQNLTSSLIGPIAYDPEEEPFTLYEALMEEAGLDDLITPTGTRGLDIIPVTEDFAGTEISLVSATGREGILKLCLERTTRLAEYDFVLFDNPPSIGLVVMNSLVASDYFMVPCSAEYLPMVGLTLLGTSIGKMQKLAPSLQVLGVVLTNYSHRESICRKTENILRDQLGENLFNTRVRVNTKAKSAPSVQKTIFDFENSAQGRGTQDYSKLAEEFLERVEAKGQTTMPNAVSQEEDFGQEQVANG